MNVKYTDINCQDAGKSIGVSTATIQGWCRNNLINFIDIGDGNKKPRYMISEDEVNYLKGLVKSHGKKKALLYYDKTRTMNVEVSDMYPPETKEEIMNEIVEEEQETKKVQFNVNLSVEDKQLVDAEARKLGISRGEFIHSLLNKKEEPTPYQDIPTRKPFDKEEAMVTLSYIQDIKERLNDIEAERNQLLNELELMKKELIESL